MYGVTLATLTFVVIKICQKPTLTGLILRTRVSHSLFARN